MLQCDTVCCSGYKHVPNYNDNAPGWEVCVAVRCSVWHRVAACCSVLQRVVACCSVLQRVAAWFSV